jgi:hypothetical protein
MPVVAGDYAARAFSGWGCVRALALLLTACGPTMTLHQVDAVAARALLPWLDQHTTKDMVIERLGPSAKYRDSSGRIVIYSVALKDNVALKVRPPEDASASYELVLVFNEEDRLKRYSLIRIK